MKTWISLAAISAALLVTPAAHAGKSLSYIGQQILPTGTQYNGTTVGGLSGIDYVASTGQYIAISDDRSQINPARFYTLDLNVTSSSFSSVAFTKVTTLLDPSGNPYAPLAIDPEAIRYSAAFNAIVYSSEGDKNNNINAFIRAANIDGSYLGEATLPGYYQQTGPAGTTGVRNNLAFESLAVSSDSMIFTTATENALVQDGSAAAFGTGSPSRILQLSAFGNAVAEFVYQVSPVAHASTPDGAFSTNGLVELIDIGNGQYLALERSFITGYTTPASSTGNSIQLYLIDTTGATNVLGVNDLDALGAYTAVSKTLLFDLDTLGIPLDNIEGMTFGPKLDDGSDSLILVSDNNFSGTQFTQFLAFSVKNAVPEPASWAMMIAGFGLAGAAMRRRTLTVRLAV